MDPPAGGAAPPPAAATAAAPGSALAGASREQLAKALERSARKLKAADERATNAEAAAERAVAESERLAKESEALVEKERSSRASAERSAAEASTRASTAETRVAELERSLASERAAKASARAEAETARAALSQASVSATATMEASQETSAALGSTRAALDAKEAELVSARAELENGSRLWDEEKRKVLGALAEIKKKMTKLERRRETLEADLRLERASRVETESRLEARLLETETELSDTKRSVAAAKERETEYRARAAALLASKDARIASLLEENKNASAPKIATRATSVEGIAKPVATRDARVDDDDASQNENENETTVRRLRRETIELRAALNDARLEFEASSKKTEALRAARDAESRRALDAATTRLARAVRERDAANVAADEARALVAQLEAEAYDARNIKNAARDAEARAARFEKETGEHKARADALMREARRARELAERATFAKDARIETLTIENTTLREEVARTRDRGVEGSEGRSETTRAGVSGNDDDDASFPGRRRNANANAATLASSYDDDDDAGFEAFTAYVLGETDHAHGGVRKQKQNAAFSGVKRSSEDAGRGVSAARGSEQTADVYAEVYAAPAAGGDAWDLGISSTLASVADFFGGGAGEVSGSSAVTPTETALGANAAAAADALLAARGTGESRA